MRTPNTKMPLLFLIYWIVIPSTAAWAVEGMDFTSLMSEFRKGNYKWVAKQTKTAIEAEQYLPKEEKLFVLYMSSESHWKEMDRVLEERYNRSPNRGAVFYNAVYLLLERALVLGNASLVEKWGYRFRLEGSTSPRYVDGLYVYATHFYETKRYKDASFLLHLAQKEKPKPALAQRIAHLRQAILTESQETGNQQ